MTALRLDRLLANLGYASRKEARGMIWAGRVTLDGRVLEDEDEKIPLDPGLSSRMTVDGLALDPPPGVVLMLHKPLGVTCSHKEAGPLVYGLLPERWRRRDPAISTIGRLDKETSGLLLMTDDGAFLHRVIAPSSRVTKVYRAGLARPLRGDEAAVFASGELMLEGETKPLLPVPLEVISPTEARLTLVEGRYHQVRRMFAAVGNHVETLHREQVGALALTGALPAGQFHILGDVEKKLIFS